MRRVIAIIATLALLLMSGCKTIEREIPVTIEHTTERVSIDIVRDTIVQRDSIYHLVMGDTVIIERWHTLQNVNHIAQTDTIVEVREVPVEVVRTEVREVNRLHWWQQGLMWLGAGLVIALLVMGIVVARRISKI